GTSTISTLGTVSTLSTVSKSTLGTVSTVGTSERGLARAWRCEQHPPLPVDADRQVQRLPADRRLDLRLEGRLQGLRNAEQPDRRRRSALRDHPDAEDRGRGRGLGARAVEVRP